ncbi:4Fe-4S dicluster domain-containing protein [bacterium]|nr:4Fe-4S dicluster domain-containing protein [bacterium]
MRDLRSIPFAAQLRRMVPEMLQHKRCYDMPERVWYKPERDAGVDFRAAMHGKPTGTPVGPAAGPHTQLAQNIVLAYVAGARFFELKTIQIMDRLEIPRPCIDVRNIGFNVEWSQELRIEESIYEYCVAAYLVSIIRGENLLGCKSPVPASQDTIVWDMSVGYDLKGIQSKRVMHFLKTMKDASKVFDQLDDELPAEFSHFRKHRPQPKLSDTLTLSTFHGCPKDEIEKIALFLLEEMDINTIVKMNPTMLGKEDVNGLLQKKLGYKHLETNPHAYEVGMTFDESVEMMQRLEKVARKRGLSVGAKFTNTLETLNKEGVLPASEKVMYLSGAPLHVISSVLAARWRRATNWMEPLSFSAGVTKENVAEMAKVGCSPITTCTDLLKPGGYGRLSPYLTELKKEMESVGAKTLPQFVRASAGNAEELLVKEFAAAGVEMSQDAARNFLHKADSVEVPGKAERMCPAAPAKDAYEALATGDPKANEAAARAILDRVTRQAMAVNWDAYEKTVTEDDRYSYDRNRREPKKIKSNLELFDCINCDKCIPVCPNDAMFAYEVKPEKVVTQEILWTPHDGFKVGDKAGEFEVGKDHQLANYADWCNECSNCMTYCPEHGGPFMKKPRFFGDRVGWLEASDDGFAIELEAGNKVHVFARINGQEYEMDWYRKQNRATLRDEFLIAEFDTKTHQVTETFLAKVLTEAHSVNTEVYHIIRTVTQGVLDSKEPNSIQAMATR